MVEQQCSPFRNVDRWLSRKDSSAYEKYRDRNRGIVKEFELKFSCGKKNVFEEALVELGQTNVPRAAVFLEAFHNRLKREGRALKCAIRCGPILKLVVFAGVPFDVEFTLKEAIKSNNYEVIESITLLREKLKCTPKFFHNILWEATRTVRDPVIFQLLSEIANVAMRDDSGRNILHLLAEINDADRSQALVEVFCEAQKQRIPDLLVLPDASGATPFQVALRQANYHFIREVFENSSTVDEKPFTQYLGEDFQLEQIDSQEVKDLFGRCVKKANPDELNCLSSDISDGDERYPIPAYNRSSKRDVRLPAFEYITMVQGIPDSTIYDLAVSCRCRDGCGSFCQSCESEKITKQRKANKYIYVAECTPACHCLLQCEQRQSLKYLHFALRYELWYSEHKGWGVHYIGLDDIRCDDTIDGNMVIAEYVGVAKKGGRCEDLYEFETIGCDNETYAISAKERGNFTRFINHSCDPNLRAEIHVRDSGNRAFPHLVLVTNQMIHFGDELTIDYGDAYWKALKDEKACRCGSEKCRYPT